MIATVLISLAALAFLPTWFENREASPETGYRIRFGIIENDTTGLYDVAVETRVIPLLTQETGFCFGYSIAPPDDRTYLTHEVIHMPAPPKHIDFQMPVVELDGGKIIRTPNIFRRDQMIYPFCFSRGDPLGTWRLEVFINDNMAKTFRFKVVRP